MAEQLPGEEDIDPSWAESKRPALSSSQTTDTETDLAADRSAQEALLERMRKRFADGTNMIINETGAEPSVLASSLFPIATYDAEKDLSTFGGDIRDRLSAAREKGWDKVLQETHRSIEKIEHGPTAWDKEKAGLLMSSLESLSLLFEENSKLPDSQDLSNFREPYTKIVLQLLPEWKSAREIAETLRSDSQPRKSSIRRLLSFPSAFEPKRGEAVTSESHDGSFTPAHSAQGSPGVFARKDSTSSMDGQLPSPISSGTAFRSWFSSSRRGSLDPTKSPTPSRRGSFPTLPKYSASYKMDKEETEAWERVAEKMTEIKDALQEMTTIYKKYEKDGETVPGAEE